MVPLPQVHQVYFSSHMFYFKVVETILDIKYVPHGRHRKKLQQERFTRVIGLMEVAAALFDLVPFSSGTI